MLICSDLTLTNGMITYGAGFPNNRPVNTVAAYSCNAGYTLNGGSTLRFCISGGNWTGLAPTCQGESTVTLTMCIQFAFHSIIDTGPTTPPPTTCSDLTNLTNGIIDYNMGAASLRPVDTVATYTCNTGYNLTGGTTSRVCVIGGIWSGSTPTCEG